MTGPARWSFTAPEAEAAAHEVVHYAPETPWTRTPVPVDSEAAAASVAALAAEFNRLPPSIRGALGRATSNAAQLSDDRLQGLAELIQNADDVGATKAFFTVDDDRLLFGHNGSDLTLPDVWGLTIPWLSEKTDNAEALGRFGIGLKTLQSLSETLEAHNGHFHLSLGRSTLAALDDDSLQWPNRPADATTIFVVPFEHGTTTQSEVQKWLEAWGDAGLLFLRSLQSVALQTMDGTHVEQLQLSRLASVTLDNLHLTRTEVSATDGRTWLLYARNAESPELARAGKARTETTPIAVAFSRFTGDQGHIHVGLPVRSTGLPFRLAGQFDPLANRRDIAESRWNLEVLRLIADLWLDAVLDFFATDAAHAWTAVPLDVEIEADTSTTGPVRAALNQHLMQTARLAFAEAVRFSDANGESHPLRDLAYETPELSDILSADDIRTLADAKGVIEHGSRSNDGRWRDVLADLEILGADTPIVIDESSAVQLLERADKPIAFLCDLTAAVATVARAEDEEDYELEDELLNAPCLVLADGTRLRPTEAADLRVLLPADRSSLWISLNLGTQVDHEYQQRDSWPVVARWLEANGALRRTATNEDALRALAAAGRDDIELAEPLTDAQADALRVALEAVEDAARPALGAGIGRAIRLEATVYTPDGRRTRSHARPADAYFIEKDKNTWSTAAKKTPGLVWLHRRYSEDLRAGTGRAGIGAQRLFRLLGAETVPRLELLPNNDRFYKRYVHHGDGLWRDAPGSPMRRRHQMMDAGAQCTRGDRVSPDLDEVLEDIAKEKSAPERRRRANALLGCLARNWDRLEPHAKVAAVNPDNGWTPRGYVDAWWVSQAASIKWLANGRGRPAAPDEVRLKTLTNEAMHGTEPTLYLADGYDQPAHREVLTALGVEGNPTVPALIARLTQIRTAHLTGQPVNRDADDAGPMTVIEAADLAAPLYQALAAEVQVAGGQRHIGNLRATAARAQFDRGDGLIITNLGWRRTSLVRSGDAIFGDLESFVPAVKGAAPLWAALGVRLPDVEDAKRVIKQLARQHSLSTDERQIMLEALRLMAASPLTRLGQLRRQPVYIGTGWANKRPVHAVENPLLADALHGKVPVWQPGGQLRHVAPLIEPLALTRVDASHTHVLHESIAEYDAGLSATFTAAVRNLQTDLALSAPATAETLSLTWEQLAAFQVALLPGLRIRIDIPGEKGHHVRLAAWVDPTTKTMFVDSSAEASRARTGGYAIASLFRADPREISHAWVVAWSDAEAGAATELVVSAADRAAEEKRRREASHAALANLPGPGEHSQNQQGGGKPAKKQTPPKPGTPGPQPATARARTLVDVAALQLNAPEGSIVAGPGPNTPEEPNGDGPTRRRKLRDPDRSNPKRPSGAGRGPLNYTAEERETAGIDLLRRALEGDGTVLTDVRHQPNVGADAVDDNGRYYELKVNIGTMPDIVKLEDSQIQRALTTDDFYLVVVSNVEAGQGDPEVLIIHDPLHHLTPEPQGAVHLSGVLSASVARSWTFAQPEEPAEDQ